MKIICSKSSLLKSVSIALKAVPSKTTMPILECILMEMCIRDSLYHVHSLLYDAFLQDA